MWRGGATCARTTSKWRKRLPKAPMPLLNDLLERGYFPIQLPPAFRTDSFAANLHIYQTALDAGPHFSHPEKFSVPKSSYYRRVTSVLNPVGFYRLARDLSAFWGQIQIHYGTSSYSASKPAHNPSIRAIDITKFSQLHEKKIAVSAGYKYALITDVSRYFPTIYTHSIPWALHGKLVAKANQTQSAQYFGNIIDARSREVQDRQTIGLPIGPDTSHIIGEIVGVAIDIAVQTQLGGALPAGFRYVDDFFMFFNARSDAEFALAAVTKALSQFELQINPNKTRIVEVSDLVEDSWRYSVKKLRISAAKKRQLDDIHHYFESMFAMEKRFKEESLIKYGLKQISSSVVKVSNWPVFESYLLKCAFSFPNTIQVVAQILGTYKYHGYPLDLQAIGRFCNSTLRSAAKSNHHGEVAWCLWMCKELGITPQPQIVADIETMESSVCAILTLDLVHNGGLGQSFTPAFLAQFAVAPALLGTGWLLAYEAGRRGWLPGGTAFIQGDPHFGPAGVEFYVQNTHLKPIFDVKPESDAPNFDSDENLDEDLEFDDMDEEYFDAASEEPDDPG